jgi:hypothetical protein
MTTVDKEYQAGSGLALDALTTPPTFSVEFAGTGSAASASHSNHDHDADYYTQTGVDTALSDKSDATHAHALDDLADVSAASPNPDDVLTWSGSEWTPESVAFASDAHTLDSVLATSFLRSDVSDSLIAGTLTVNVGAELDVAGTLTISGGSPGAGKVLTSDASGTATWQNLATGATWDLAGNAGLVAGTDFLGTTDNVAVDLRVNDIRALRLEPTTGTPNVIGGNPGNNVTAGMTGATIAGGGTNASPNSVTGISGFVGGGQGCRAGQWAVVAGGLNSHADGNVSFVGGGSTNYATNTGTTVAGGVGNQATQPYAAVCGGQTNLASGHAAMVSGGEYNVASGDHSFAAGQRAKATANGVFVWADSETVDFVVTQADTFAVRAAGGVGINTANPTSALHVNGPITLNTQSITSLTYTMTTTDNVIFASPASAGGDVTITLPAAETTTIGRVLYIYNVDGGGNVLLAAQAGDAVQGTTTITAAWQCVRVIGFTADTWIATLQQ